MTALRIFLWSTILASFAMGCTPEEPTSSSISLSSAECANEVPDGVVTPPPGMPSFLPQYRVGEKLTVVVDLHCKASPTLKWMEARQLQFWRSHSKSRTRAYTVEINEGEVWQSQLRRDPCIRSVAKDVAFRLMETTPSDPLFSSQSYMSLIQAPAAYDIFYDGTTGISSEVVIAVIDNGVDVTHEDLDGQLWTNSTEVEGNGIDDDGNGYIDDYYGYNFASHTGAVGPESGGSHGTHVAGLVAARADNGLGIAGVIGRHAQIMSLNVFGPSDSASTANIINAINYAVAEGADIINLSLGGYGIVPGVEQALRDAVAAGVSVFAAAGNEAVSLDQYFIMPASYAKDIEGVVAVASVDVGTERLSGFSNFSSTYVELAAPGSDRQYGLISLTPGDSYGGLQGTSMSTPLASGAAALALSLARSRGGAMSPAELESLLLAGSLTRGVLSGSVKNCKQLDLNELASVVDAQYP